MAILAILAMTGLDGWNALRTRDEVFVVVSWHGFCLKGIGTLSTENVATEDVARTTMTYLVGRTSHYATTFESLRTISKKSAQYRLSSDRLSSGRKFSQLSAYRSDLTDVLTYRRVVDRANKDRARIEKVLTITQTYELTLRATTSGSSSGSNAGGLQSYIEPFSEIVREGLQPNVDATAWREKYSGEDFENRLRAIQSLLNTKVGNRYIFAGRRYREGAPVRDLTGLTDAPLPSAAADYEAFLLRNLPASATDASSSLIEALSVSPTFPIANANAERVADHDRDASDTPTSNLGENIVRARTTSVLQVENNQLIEYGISSNAEPINYLLLGVRLVKRALDTATTTLADRRTLLSDARELFDFARDGLRRLRQSSSGTIATLLVAQERQQEIEITTQSLVDRLVAADTTRAGIELSALSQQFSATLQTIETRNSLSLARLL